MRDIKEFVPWLTVEPAPQSVLTIIQTVTGIDLCEPGTPAEPFDFAKCVLLVEHYELHSQLCDLATLSPEWWRIVGNWGRLVDALGEVAPNWRQGEYTAGISAQAILDALHMRQPGPRKLLLDMDGPIADLDRQVWDDSVAAGWKWDIETLDQFIHRYSTVHIIDPEHREAARALINQPGWFRALPVTPGAQEGVEALLAAGHEITVCTKPLATNPTCRDEKYAWLVEHFPMLAPEMITAPNKSRITGDLLLDDAIDHAQAAVAGWEPVVFRMPFNGTGTEWGHYPNWGWGDPIERLAW